MKMFVAVYFYYYFIFLVWRLLDSFISISAHWREINTRNKHKVQYSTSGAQRVQQTRALAAWTAESCAQHVHRPDYNVCRRENKIDRLLCFAMGPCWFGTLCTAQTTTARRKIRRSKTKNMYKELLTVEGNGNLTIWSVRYAMGTNSETEI